MGAVKTVSQILEEHGRDPEKLAFALFKKDQELRKLREDMLKGLEALSREVSRLTR